MNFFVKSIALLSFLLIVTNSYGQEEKRPVRIGVGGAFSTEVEKGGIGAYSSFHITDHTRIVPGFTYFFPKTEVLSYGEQTFKLWEIFVDAHFLFFEPTHQFNIYGIGGINYSFINDEGYTEDPIDPSQPYYFSKKSYEPGLNLGAGFELRFGGRVYGSLDIKYEISGYSQVVVKAGLFVRVN